MPLTSFFCNKLAVKSGRNQNGINHVNHAVGAFDVIGRDVNAFIQLNTVGSADLDRCAVDCCSTLAIHGHDVSGHHFTCHYMVGEDGRHFGNVFKQSFLRAIYL